MKNLNKTLAAVLIAASMSMTSCVDNEVAPEVKQLREAQVALVSAKADLAAAEAALRDIDVKESEAQLEVSLKQKQTALKQADLAFQEAVKNLEIKIASLGNEKAQEYLNEYSNAAGNLSNIVGSQLVAQADLAQAKVILDSENASWVVTKATLETQLAEQQGLLTAQKAALELLKGVQVDPSTSASEVNELRKQIADLEHKNLKISIDLEKIIQAQSAALTKLNNAYDYMYEYNDLTYDLSSIITSIHFANQSKVTAQQDLDEANAILTAANAALTSAKSALTEMQNKYNTALATKNTKEADRDKAYAELQVAQNNDAANGTNTAPAKQTAYDDAVTAYNDAVTALNTAQSNRNTAQSLVNNKQYDVESATDNVNGSIDNLNSANSSLADYTAQKAKIEAEMAALKPGYDDAVANINTYESNYQIKQAEYIPLYTQQSANSSLMAELDAVANEIENYLSNINYTIANKQNEIDNTKSTIHYLEEQISGTGIDKAYQQEEVARLEAEVARLTAEVTAQQAIVAKWKALLDSALAAS